MAFVALKALKWALKGQKLASDTLEILLANAYHWNPCWKVDEMSHFWVIVYNIDKSITFFLHIICHDFSSISIYLTQFDSGVLCLLCLKKKAIFNQSQSFPTKLRDHATSTFPARSAHGHTRPLMMNSGGDHQRARQAQKCPFVM